MELFKTNFLKKEFERFQNEELINVLQCWLCQCNLCEWDKKFKVACDRYRKARCKAYSSFDIAKENLFKNLDKEGKDYLENFEKGFLNLSNETVKESFAITKVTLPRLQNYMLKVIIKAKNVEVKLFKKT